MSGLPVEYINEIPELDRNVIVATRGRAAMIDRKAVAFLVYAKEADKKALAESEEWKWETHAPYFVPVSGVPEMMRVDANTSFVMAFSSMLEGAA